MIDLASEQVVSLHDVPRRLPRRRGGRPVHVSCVYRWTTRGCRGLILESIQIGGTRCTSIEALTRFFDALRRVRMPELAGPRRTREMRRAANMLAKDGI